MQENEFDNYNTRIDKTYKEKKNPIKSRNENLT